MRVWSGVLRSMSGAPYAGFSGTLGPLTRRLKKVVMPTTIERRCSVVMSGGSVRWCREIHGQQKGTAPSAAGAVPGASLLQAGVNLTEDLANLGA